MKNNLLDLAKNANTLLEVRDKLLGDCEFEAYRDVDTEKEGFWVKKAIGDKRAAIGLYLKTGRGISVNINTLERYEVLEGTPSFREVMDKIGQFMTELYGKGWDV